jgi:hypothetical protein
MPRPVKHSRTALIQGVWVRVFVHEKRVVTRPHVTPTRSGSSPART